MLWKNGWSSGLHHTKPPPPYPKWMFFQSLFFKSSFPQNGLFGIQQRPPATAFALYLMCDPNRIVWYMYLEASSPLNILINCRHTDDSDKTEVLLWWWGLVGPWALLPSIVLQGPHNTTRNHHRGPEPVDCSAARRRNNELPTNERRQVNSLLRQLDLFNF